MKALGVITIILIGLVINVDAMHDHERKSPEERASNQTERLTEKLSLNDEQKQEVLKHSLSLHTGLEALHNQNKDDHKAKREEAKSLFDTWQANVEQVLDEKQKVVFAEHVEAHKGKMKSKRKHKHKH